jgi:hypothetical protein
MVPSLLVVVAYDWWKFPRALLDVQLAATHRLQFNLTGGGREFTG